MALRKRIVDSDSPGIPDNGFDSPLAPRRLSVGETLRGRRIECALELDHVAHVLRLRPAVVTAIEEDRFGDLPSPVYAVGFVRSYAKYLGLDAEAIVVRFKAETSDMGRKPHLHFPLPIRDSRVPTGPLLAVCLLIAMATYGGWYFYSRGEHTAEQVPAVPDRLRQTVESDAGPKDAGPKAIGATAQTPAAAQPQPTTPATPPAVAAATSDTTTAVAPAVAPASPAVTGDGVPPVEARQGPGSAASTPATQPDLVQPALSGDAAKLTPPGSYGAPDGGARVVLKANADSWIQIRDKGGNLLFTRVLKTGERYNAPNQPGLSLVAGNAGGLDIAVDGVDIPHIGEPGRVARNVSLDPDRLLGAARHVN